MRQAVVCSERSDVRQFSLIGPQKFLTRRNVIEQVADRDGGARGSGKFVAAQDLSACNFHRRSGAFFGSPRFEQQPGDRCDGRQCFATESQGGDREQIFYVAELAGGVAFKGQQRIVAQHAAAIVGNPDQAAAAAVDIDAKVGGSGVERIFDEFFYNRRGALNHLSGRDFVGDVVGEDANSAHELAALKRSWRKGTQRCCAFCPVCPAAVPCFPPATVDSARGAARRFD